MCVKLLKESKINMIMTENGDRLENTITERVSCIL